MAIVCLPINTGVTVYSFVSFIVSEGAEIRVNCLQPCNFHCLRRNMVSSSTVYYWFHRISLCFSIVSEGAELCVSCLQPCLLKYYWFHHIFLCFSPYFPVFFHCFRRCRVSCELPAAVSPEVLLGSEYP